MMLDRNHHLPSLSSPIRCQDVIIACESPEPESIERLTPANAEGGGGITTMTIISQQFDETKLLKSKNSSSSITSILSIVPPCSSPSLSSSQQKQQRRHVCTLSTTNNDTTKNNDICSHGGGVQINNMEEEDDGRKNNPCTTQPKGPVVVVAPMNVPLGIDINNITPTISYIEPTSPLLGKLNIGDVLISIDGQSTAELSHFAVTELLNGRSRSSNSSHCSLGGGGGCGIDDEHDGQILITSKDIDNNDERVNDEDDDNKNEKKKQLQNQQHHLLLPHHHQSKQGQRKFMFLPRDSSNVVSHDERIHQLKQPKSKQKQKIVIGPTVSDVSLSSQEGLFDRPESNFVHSYIDEKEQWCSPRSIAITSLNEHITSLMVPSDAVRMLHFDNDEQPFNPHLVLPPPPPPLIHSISDVFPKTSPGCPNREVDQSLDCTIDSSFHFQSLTPLHNGKVNMSNSNSDKSYNDEGYLPRQRSELHVESKNGYEPSSVERQRLDELDINLFRMSCDDHESKNQFHPLLSSRRRCNSCPSAIIGRRREGWMMEGGNPNDETANTITGNPIHECIGKRSKGDKELTAELSSPPMNANHIVQHAGHDSTINKSNSKINKNKRRASYQRRQNRPPPDFDYISVPVKSCANDDRDANHIDEVSTIYGGVWNPILNGDDAHQLDHTFVLMERGNATDDLGDRGGSNVLYDPNTYSQLCSLGMKPIKLQHQEGRQNKEKTEEENIGITMKSDNFVLQKEKWRLCMDGSLMVLLVFVVLSFVSIVVLVVRHKTSI